MGRPSKEDLYFNELRYAHEDRFGKSYGVTMGDRRPLSVHIAILEEALRTGVPAEPLELNVHGRILV